MIKLLSVLKSNVYFIAVESKERIWNDATSMQPYYDVLNGACASQTCIDRYIDFLQQVYSILNCSCSLRKLYINMHPVNSPKRKATTHLREN